MKVDNFEKENPVYFRGIELQCDLEAEHKALNWVLSEDKEQLEEMRKQYKGAIERVKSHPVKVKNQWGRIIHFEDSFYLMDDDICELGVDDGEITDWLVEEIYNGYKKFEDLDVF